MNTKNVDIRNVMILLLLFIISTFTFKVFDQIHFQNYENLSQAAYGVIIGKPRWIAYQNRLLGPYLVYFISKFGFSFQASLKVFTWLGIFVENIILHEILSKYRFKTSSILGFIITFTFVFLAIQHYWFYTWDTIDIIIFTLFSWGIFVNKKLYYFMLLFVVALLNRESALFISSYLMVDSIVIKFKPNFTFILFSKIKLLTGMLLTFVGIVYTNFIRHKLFVSTALGDKDLAHQELGNHIQIHTNYRDLVINNLNLKYSLFSLVFLNTIFFILITLYASYNIKNYSQQAIKAYIIFILMIINVFVFGLINETRMYLVFLPFLMLFFIENNQSEGLEFNLPEQAII